MRTIPIHRVSMPKRRNLSLTQSTSNLGAEYPFWQVVGIGDREDNQLRADEVRPVEKIVNHVLFGSDELV